MIVEHGTVVTLDFELRDAQGELIQEHGGEPIIYLHGSENEVFPKLQEAVEARPLAMRCSFNSSLRMPSEILTPN